MAHPRTTFIVANDRDGLILEKLAGMEQAIDSLVPLLEKIITQMEAQAPAAGVPIATYRDLYDEPEAGPPEGELVASNLAPPAGERWVVRVARWLGVVHL